MKRLLLIPILLLFLCSTLWAAEPVQLARMTSLTIAGVTVACDGYLICQGFETATTGYDNSESWAETGETITPNDTASPSPLVGAQSLRLNDTGTDPSSCITFSATDPVYGYLQVNIDTKSGDPSDVFKVLASGDTQIFSFYTNAVYFIVYDNQNRASTVAASGDTLYHVWWDYDSGASNDGKINIFISTTSTKPATADIIVTDSPTQGSAVKFCLGTQNGQNMVVDKVRIKTSTIGSNPD